MTNSTPQWRLRCAELGLDPQQVRSVSGRYDMYERYTAAQHAEVLPLARWYKWYRIEKLADGHALLTPPAAGCSIDGDTKDCGPVVSEADFLELLDLYRRTDSR